MKNFLLSVIIFAGIFCNVAIGQTVKLTAVYDLNNTAVKLNWNMVASNYHTGYILLKSTDGISWTEAAKDRRFRSYTDNDVYFFNDRYFSQGKNFYRIRIADEYNKTIALSTIVIVNTAPSLVPTKAPVYAKTQAGSTQQTQNKIPVNQTTTSGSNSWIIYPNPATDILKLAYKGSAELKGVVNVQIQDASGKVVIKFRSGSMYKNIEIPISNLRRGAYFIQVSVMNELMMNQRFIKQ